MRNHTRHLFFYLCLCAWFVGAPAHAKTPPDHWNLGSIGAKADFVNKQPVISEVYADGPAEDKLRKGDILVAADGKALGDTPFETLGRALDRAEKAGSITLSIQRDGSPSDVKLKLPKLGTYAGAFHSKNSKVKKHIKTACAFVAKTQQGGGLWHKYRDGRPHRGDAITVATVMSALGLMAADAKKYKNSIKAARTFVLAEVRPDELGRDATKGLHRNWPVAFTCLFLAEFYGQTGDKTVRKKLENMLDRLAQNQEATGGWSHFPGFSEGPGYVSLSSLTALALIAQGIAVKTGIKVDAASIKKGLDYLEGCVGDDGSVAYSAVNGVTDLSAGRACGALCAFVLHGRTSEAAARVQAYVLKDYTNVLESHPASLTGVLFAVLLGGATREHSNADLAGFQAKLLEHLLPYTTLARHPTGYFVAQPSHESRRVGATQDKGNADREAHDPYWATAIHLMLHTATNPKLIGLGARARRR